MEGELLTDMRTDGNYGTMLSGRTHVEMQQEKFTKHSQS